METALPNAPKPEVPEIRKGQGDMKISHEVFRERFRERFYDPASRIPAQQASARHS